MVSFGLLEHLKLLGACQRSPRLCGGPWPACWILELWSVNVNVAVKRCHPSAFQALPGIHRLRCSPRYHSELQSIISASEQEREPICDGKAC